MTSTKRSPLLVDLRNFPFSVCLLIIDNLAESLVEQDDAAQVLSEIWGGEEELSITTSIFLGVLDVDGSKSYAD